MNYSGIIVGLISLAIIGLWHFIVIKGEYLLGKRICMCRGSFVYHETAPTQGADNGISLIDLLRQELL